MPYHCVSHLPVQSGAPSITHRRSRSSSARHGTSVRTLARVAYFIRSRWQSAKLFVCQGLTAPPASVLPSSGTTRPKSTPITRPKPRQRSQAPIGELNENRLGSGSA